jgi:chromate transporter
MPVLSATVAGVMLNLAVYLGKAVLFPHSLNISEIQIFSLLWLGLSLFVLFKFKVNMILWMGISAAAGVIKFLTGL